MQLLGVLMPLLPLIKAQYLDLSTISIQSENASCLASHNIIACIHHLNKELEGLGLTVVPWIHTEVQTGRGRLDTYLTVVNTVFQS
jgi:hypothetical protein